MPVGIICNAAAIAIGGILGAPVCVCRADLSADNAGDD